MGGGPLDVDVVRSTCLLTFPEDSQLDPLAVDVRFLHAIGLRYVRFIVRERLGQSDGKYGLLLQQQDQATRSSMNSTSCRFVAISSDQVLRKCLAATFPTPEIVVLLHLISLHNVADLTAVYVRPQRNPRFSPEPVQALDLVMPVLSIHNDQGFAQVVPRMELLESKADATANATNETAQHVDNAEPKSESPSSVGVSNNNNTDVRDCANADGNTRLHGDVTTTMAADLDQNATVNPAIDNKAAMQMKPTVDTDKKQIESQQSLQVARVADTPATTCGISSLQHESMVPKRKPPRSKPVKSSCASTNDSLTSQGSTCSSSLLLDSPSRSAPGSPVYASEINSRSTSAPSSRSSPASPVSPRSLLSASMPLGASSEPSFFISSSWHLQAEEMSASLRLHRDRRNGEQPPKPKQKSRSLCPPPSHHHLQQRQQQQQYRPHSAAASGQGSTRTSLGDSFVFLEKWWKSSS